MKALAQCIRRYLGWPQFMVNIRIARRRILFHQARIKGKVLDIGAGDQPYRSCFREVDEYVATNTRRFYGGEALARIESFTDAWIEDAIELPFDDASFDGVLSFQVLSVIADPRRFFRESARVLRGGGTLMLTTDFLYPQWSDTDVMRHTDKHLARMAQEAGFEVVAMESLGGLFTMVHSVFSRYVREYPQYVNRATGVLTRLFRIMVLLLYLLLTPVISLVGMVIYLAEKKLLDAHDFTVGTLMVCRKSRS